ncbi:hypothetical protein [Sorangium sp. So ce131]|uniref:hypothetical protein n=1 Tax=Sorangium sp. So ce131 TaxID=3133282 RepID=UPI003F6075F0
MTTSVALGPSRRTREAVTNDATRAQLADVTSLGMGAAIREVVRLSREREGGRS